MIGHGRSFAYQAVNLRWRPDLDLKGGETLDHNHRAATERTSPERNGRVGVSASWRRWRTKQPGAGAYTVEPVCRGGGWPGIQNGECGRTHVAAHAAKSGARIRRRGGSEVASCSCERSPANGTSPCHQQRRRAGGWKSQRDEYTRRDSEVPARVRRTVVCSRPPSATSRVGGSNFEIASAEPGRRSMPWN